MIAIASLLLTFLAAYVGAISFVCKRNPDHFLLNVAPSLLTGWAFLGFVGMVGCLSADVAFLKSKAQCAIAAGGESVGCAAISAPEELALGGFACAFVAMFMGVVGYVVAAVFRIKPPAE